MPEHDPLTIAAAWLAQGRPLALATVIQTWGSSPCPVGSRLVVALDGAIAGSVSGGCIEADVILHAREVIAQRRPRTLSYGVSDGQAWATGLACGGQVRVLVEPVG